MKINAEHKITVTLFRIQYTTFALQALNCTFGYGVVTNRTLPTSQIFSIEKYVELFAALRQFFVFSLAQNFIGFLSAELLQLYILETNLSSVRLQLNRAALNQRLPRGEVIMEPCIDHNRLVVEPHPASLSDQTHLHRVPLTYRIIRTDQWIFTSPSRWIVP